MKLKKKSQAEGILNLFDILDSSRKETNLSKVLAYLIGKDIGAFGALMNALDIKISQNRKTCLRSASISIETTHSCEYLNREDYKAPSGGRTDIEIEFTDKDETYFIIVECKVANGKATIEQYNLYKGLFEKKKANKNYFVFLSHQSGINLLEENSDINVIDLNWRELINYLAEANPMLSELEEFLKYYERSYGMANQKEILIQQLGLSNEIERYERGVYRRDKVNGSPLYFAPYYSKGLPKHGISSISKILGIVTTSDISWKKVELTCEKMVQNAYKDDTQLQEEILKRWKSAFEITDELEGKLGTYYFLDKPIEICPSLKKDGGTKKGRGKGWIAANIPKNRTVTFSKFLEQYNLAHENN